MTSTLPNQYPIGAFVLQPFTQQLWKEKLLDIHFFPKELELVVQHLDYAQLHSAYRPGGWTIHTLVHHLADSHLHAYTRCKFALLEPGKHIPAYDENAWVTTADVVQEPINYALTLLHAVHHKWHAMLQAVTQEQIPNAFVYHVALQREASLWELVSTYSWHGKHHYQQIVNALQTP
jgi:hypothetical protein